MELKEESKMKQVKIVIKSFKDKEYRHEIGIMSERKAEKVIFGVLRNLNTEEYYVDEEDIKTGKVEK